MSIEDFNKISHYVCDYPSKWARESPDEVALIDADEGKYVTWKEFETMINIRALELIDMGYQKGDIMITMLPLIPEHIYMEYAAFKIGMIVCPLDVRLKIREALYCVGLLHKARRILYVHPDDTDSEDKWGRKKFYAFRQIADAVRKKYPFVKDYIQLGPQEDAAKGTIGIFNFLRTARRKWKRYKKDLEIFKEKMALLEERQNAVDPAKDGMMIVYTTGSTGFPKPALLSNAGTVCQNMCLQKGVEFTRDDRLLINLPMSHVAAQTIAVMGSIFVGAKMVILHGFRADKSLQAIQDYKITFFGQIPALFAMEWNLPNFHDYDLSSVRLALYGAQGMSKPQLEKFSKLAPTMATGLGMTEMHGFISYQVGGKEFIDDFVSGLGHDFPVTPISVRKPMNEDGTAGEELVPGEVGEICVSGPQVFLGYYDNEEATRKTISKEGIYYTGDMGYMDEIGLHLAGRRKFIIKPKGYQVYPPEVENHIQLLKEVELAGVIGVHHEIFTDGVVAFVEKKQGKNITKKQLADHCKSLAAYKRPSLFIFTDEVERFEDGLMPLNRTEKTDYQILHKAVPPFIEAERAAGRWDASAK
ncbi:MAG: class I adenylate-forming enzyme family protein [Candidatus Hodarchaeota archaeon]